jgi:hypothetical protein
MAVAEPREHAWGIVGYRDAEDHERFERSLASIIALFGKPAQLIGGGRAGVDTMARVWAGKQGIPLVEHRPEVRNARIVSDSTLIVAFLVTADQSRDELDVIAQAKRARKFVIMFVD